MIVTRDKYELPVIVEDSVKELAKAAGMNPRVLSSAISHGYKGYCRVEIEDEEAG